MAGAGDIETVTVIRPTGRDPYGDPLPGAGSQFDIPGCQFAPGSSTETNFGANVVDTDGAVYAPPDAEVLPGDRMVIRGELYNVVGKPQVWGSFGVVIKVRQVTG